MQERLWETQQQLPAGRTVPVGWSRNRTTDPATPAATARSMAPAVASACESIPQEMLRSLTSVHTVSIERWREYDCSLPPRRLEPWLLRLTRPRLAVAR